MKETKEKEIVDLMGATEKVLKNMKEFSDKARKEADDNMIKPEKYWAYIMQAIKDDMGVTSEALLYAGAPATLVMETIIDVKEASYKRVILTKADGTTQEIAIDEFSTKLMPHTKEFGSPMEALIKGNPDSILQVIQKLYGKDIAQWSAPAEEALVMPYLSALALVEFYNLTKFDKESALFEVVEDELTIKEDAAKILHDAFDKEDSKYLLALFPHVLPEYPMALVQEAQTVLNTLSPEEMDLLFPHIQPEYLVNLKESELDALVVKFVEACGYKHPKKEKVVKKKEKKEEALNDSNPEVYQDVTFTLNLGELTSDEYAGIMRMVNEESTDVNTYTYVQGPTGPTDVLNPEVQAYVDQITGKGE